MARVTIEDSLKACPNLFHLIRLASFRAHQLQRGATPKIEVKRTEEGRVDAPTVFALREIAAGFTDFENEVIPQRDAWGNPIPVRDIKQKESEVFEVRNKETKEVFGTDLSREEAEELKDEVVAELRAEQKRKEDKDDGTDIL